MNDRNPSSGRIFLVASIFCFAILLSTGGHADQRGLPRDALWQVVHNVCVPEQLQHQDATPCIHVDLSGGTEKGFALLKDPRGAYQFLLVPTAPISGIESPLLLNSKAENYFADAWKSRTYVSAALHRELPRGAIGLAINSLASRSQDQLHIHIACVRPDVSEALLQNQEAIGSQWIQLGRSLMGHNYTAIWVTDESLHATNPFKLLADSLPGSARNMEQRTLVVIGLTRADGTNGFVILSDQVDRAHIDLANGEELLDSNCRIAAGR